MEATYATKEALKATDDVAKDAQSRVDIVEGKIDEITSVGGEPNVVEKIKVNGVTLEVEKDATGKSTKAVNIEMPTKVSDLTDDTGFDGRITAAQNKANDAADAAAAAQNAAEVADGKAVKNAEDIVALQQADTTANGKIQALENTVNNEVSGVAANYAAVVKNAGDITALTATVGTHTTDIADLKTATGNNATEITGLKSAVGNVYTKTETDNKYATKAEVGTPTTGKTIVQMIADAQAAATYDDTAVQTLIGSDANKSARAIAAEEVAKIVDGAPEAMNTLKEVAEWIENDETGAAAMAAGIAENKEEIKRVEAKIPGVDDKTIKLAENKAYVAEVSTDILVQGAQELVLCGGNASGFATV